MGTEKVGVEFTQKGAKKVARSVAEINEEIGKLGKSRLGTVTSALKKIQAPIANLRKQGGFLGNILPDVSGLTSAMNVLTGATGSTAAGMEAATASTVGMGTAAGGTALAIAGMAAAVVAGGAAFLALGKRGAQSQAVLNAFGGSTAGIIDATKALNRLRAATRGTVTDMELMQLTNISLTGTNREFREELLRVGDDGDIAIGKIIDGTNRIAAATGQSAEIIRGKFLTGLKLSSKLRVDDAIGTFDAAKANEVYAESIGKTVDQLTEQEKKLAFARGAIMQLDDVVAGLGDRQGIIENLTRPFVFLQNTLDRIAIAIQPVFAVFAQVVGDITSAAQGIADVVIPIFAALADIVGTVLATSYNIFKTAVMAATAPLLAVAGEVIPYVIAAFQIMADIVREVARVFNGVLGAIQNQIRQWAKAIGLDTSQAIEKLVFTVVKGGTKVAAGFAAGLLRGGKFVIDAVTQIARIVANFLVGLSPPKEGPLKDIDKGGANVAKAWSDGLLSNFKNPAEEIARQVEARLATLGKLSIVQVNARLAELDKAIQPFVDNLAIAKADFEAIAGFTDPALAAIERQTANLLDMKNLNIDQVRQLDKQKDVFKELQRRGQGIVDNAQIQLSIAKSQQAQERTLLEILQKRLGIQQKITGSAGAAEDAAKKAAKKAKGTGEPPPEDVPAGEGIQVGEPPDLFSSEKVEAAKALIGQAFGEGLEESGYNEALAGFTASTGELGVELSRIAGADPIGSLKKKFEGIEELADPFSGLRDGIKDTLGEIPNFIDTLNIPGVMQTMADGVLAAVSPFGEGGAIRTVFTGMRTAIMGVMLSLPGLLTGIIGEEGSLGVLISSFSTFITDKFEGIKETLINTFLSVFGDGQILGSGGLVQLILGTDGLMRVVFDGFIKTIKSKLSALKLRLFTFVLSDIPSALRSLPTKLKETLVDPFVAAINNAIDAIDGVLPDSVEIDFGQVSVPNIFDFKGLLEGSPDMVDVNLPGFTIDLPDNPFRTAANAAAGRARGGLDVRGLTAVGEKGVELINLKTPADVFPSALSQRIMRSLPAAGGTTNNNSQVNSPTFHNTFNMGNPVDVLIMQQQMATELA